MESTRLADRMPDMLVGPSAFVVALLLTFTVYHPSLSAWFVADDSFWLIPITISDLLSYFHSSWGHGIAFRPLMRCSYYIDYLLYGAHPMGWHITNLFLQSCNAAWIFILLRRLTRSTALSSITFLLFTLSPWGHQNVAWISGRTYLLCAFFFFPALYAYLRYLSSGRGYVLAISLALFLACLLTYEAAVSLPFVILLLTLFDRRPGQRPAKSLVGIAVFLGLLVVFLAYRYSVLGGTAGKVDDTHDNYLLGLVLNVRDIIYMFTLYFPLCLPIAALSAIATLHGVLRHKFRSQDVLLLLGVALVLYLPFSAMRGLAARFIYLVQVPFLFVFAWGISRMLEGGPRSMRLAAVLYLGTSALLAGWQTHRLAREWRVAGDMAYSIVTQVTEHASRSAAHRPLVLFDIPDRYGHALVLRTYCEEAVYLRSPELAGRIHRADYMSEDDLNVLLSRSDNLLLTYDRATGELVPGHSPGSSPK